MIISTALSEQIYKYLGFSSVGKSAETDAVIAQCLEELEKVAHFRYIFKYFSNAPEFLKKKPYESYLAGSRGVFVAVMTLGGEADRRIKFYARTDAAKSLVFDACASAYLEYLSDEREKTLGENLSYRFCPGYGGSDIKDIDYIFEILRPEKIGVTRTDTGYMLPSKTMAGIIADGGCEIKSCKGCVNESGCAFKKEGGRCYGSEKK